MRTKYWQRVWFFLTGQKARMKNAKPLSPRQLLGEMFEVIQLSKTFDDSKTFVDAVPRQSIKKIKKDYQKQYRTQLDIRRFVKDHFRLPEPAIPETSRKVQAIENLPIKEYIDSMWRVLTRDSSESARNSSLLPLPYRFVVPGGRFREVYYWDSYFALLGLKESGYYDVVESMVQNFAHLINTYGYIPNGNRSYYLGRSHPPVFALMVELLAEIQGEQVCKMYAAAMRTEYDYWMRGTQNASFKQKNTHCFEHVVRMPGGELLNRYWDELASPREESFVEDVELGRTLEESAEYYRHMRAGAESGWDYSSRWLIDDHDLKTIRTTDIVPIDLNVWLLKIEEMLARAYQLQSKKAQATHFHSLADTRRLAIQNYLWDEEAGWFVDYVFSESARSAQQTIAGAFALFGGVATTEQAQRIVQTIWTDFMKAGGVATTHVESGQQWDAPNGWAPLQYITVMGLERYGESELAREIAVRWCSLNISQYQKTGQLFEKYNIEQVEHRATGGEYEVQTGFGWTNGVLLTFMNKYHIE